MGEEIYVVIVSLKNITYQNVSMSFKILQQYFYFRISIFLILATSEHCPVKFALQEDGWYPTQGILMRG